MPKLFVVRFYDQDANFWTYQFKVEFPSGLNFEFWERDNAKVFETFDAVLTPRTGFVIERVISMVEEGHFPSISIKREERDLGLCYAGFHVSPEDLLTLLGICKLAMFVESDDAMRRSFFEEVL